MNKMALKKLGQEAKKYAPGQSSISIDKRGPIRRKIDPGLFALKNPKVERQQWLDNPLQQSLYSRKRGLIPAWENLYVNPGHREGQSYVGIPGTDLGGSGVRDQTIGSLLMARSFLNPFSPTSRKVSGSLLGRLLRNKKVRNNVIKGTIAGGSVLGAKSVYDSVDEAARITGVSKGKLLRYATPYAKTLLPHKGDTNADDLFRNLTIWGLTRPAKNEGGIKPTIKTFLNPAKYFGKAKMKQRLNRGAQESIFEKLKGLSVDDIRNSGIVRRLQETYKDDPEAAKIMTQFLGTIAATEGGAKLYDKFSDNKDAYFRRLLEADRVKLPWLTGLSAAVTQLPNAYLLSGARNADKTVGKLNAFLENSFPAKYNSRGGSGAAYINKTVQYPYSKNIASSGVIAHEIGHLNQNPEVLMKALKGKQLANALYGITSTYNKGSTADRVAGWSSTALASPNVAMELDASLKGAKRLWNISKTHPDPQVRMNARLEAARTFQGLMTYVSSAARPAWNAEQAARRRRTNEK